jgi:hypothetical protein
MVFLQDPAACDAAEARPFRVRRVELGLHI